MPASSTAAEQRALLEQKAIQVAMFENAAPTSDPHEGEAEFCPRDKLRVSYVVPSGEFEQGGYVEPLGPAPDANTESVNGIVVCEGFNYAYMGFEAYRGGSGWVVVPIPADEHDHMELELSEPEVPPAPEPAPLPAPTAPPSPAPKPKPASPGLAMPSPNLPSEIDGYATYEAQNSCDPSAKPAVSSFRSIVLQRHPATRSAGITRACHIGGRSEHKEGRAWDWWVSVNKPGERASAEQVIGWLLATDSAGNRHAMARRTGTMYIVWNRQIWSSYRANEGWRAYGGPKPHTDHVHFSFSWAGATGKTSYWSGKAVQTSFAPPPAATSGGSWGHGGHKAKRPSEQRERASAEELRNEWKKRRSKLAEALESTNADGSERTRRRRFRDLPEHPDETSEDPTKPAEEKSPEAPVEKPADGGGGTGESLTPPATQPPTGSEQASQATAPAGNVQTSVPSPPSAEPSPVPSPSPTVVAPTSSEGSAMKEKASAGKQAGQKKQKLSRQKRDSYRKKPARQPRKARSPRRRKVRTSEHRRDRNRTSSDDPVQQPASDGGNTGSGPAAPQTSAAP